jgi:acyl-CoA reductase-like NAD-dependent aldehyde dehydrogenase
MSTQTLEQDMLFSGGEWSAPRGSGRIEVISPSTESVVGSVPEASSADVDDAVRAACAAFEAPDGWAS